MMYIGRRRYPVSFRNGARTLRSLNVKNKHLRDTTVVCKICKTENKIVLLPAKVGDVMVHLQEVLMPIPGSCRNCGAKLFRTNYLSADYPNDVFNSNKLK